MSSYSSLTAEYFVHEGKPHYNFANKIAHSNFYKTMVPWRTRYENQVGERKPLPVYFGNVPQHTWIYGNLDYSFNKQHRHLQGEDWYPDRKNKSLGSKRGGIKTGNTGVSKYMKLHADMIPRGCYREIQKYQSCTADKAKAECLN